MNESTVFHVEIDGHHHYFGSVAAIFDYFTPDQLGVSKQYVWQLNITPEKPYRNKHCIIRRGILHRKEQTNKRKNGNKDNAGV